MTEHRTMNTIIHAAFRRDLARFDASLAAFTGGDPARVEQLGAAWDHYAHQVQLHHEHEEEIFWPALRTLGVDEALAAALDDEHREMQAALEEATAKLRGFRSDPSAETAANARAAVARFGTVLVRHCEHEERDLEPWMADRLDTPELKGAVAAVRKAQQGSAGTFFAWLEDGAGPDERAALRRQLPAPVLWLITTIGGRDYRKRIAPTWG